MKCFLVKMSLIIISAFVFSACSDPWSKSTDKYFRKMAPHHMKWQMYKGTPTPYNQFSQDEYGNFVPAHKEEEVREHIYRKLRNGTMPLDEREELGAYRHLSGFQDVVPDDYGRGFTNGCKTFDAVMGIGPSRMGKYEVNSYDIINNDSYLRGYQDAASFCTFRIDWEVH